MKQRLGAQSSVMGTYTLAVVIITNEGNCSETLLRTKAVPVLVRFSAPLRGTGSRPLAAAFGPVL